MSSADPELIGLLIEELERHLTKLEAVPREIGEAKRSLHALRGSAGLAGERELAATLDRLHRRIREGDDDALGEAAAIVRSAVQRLSAGERAVAQSWPVPPEDLVVTPIDPLVRAQYAAEVTDRLARIDDALATSGDPVDAVRALYRHVHTMKGAASAVGDEPMTWFCHGLEEKIRGADSTAKARAAMHEVARWRATLGAFLDEPVTTLATLGARRTSSSGTVRAAAAVRAVGAESPPRGPAYDEDTATIRVRAADVDRLVERIDVIDRARERMASRGERGREAAVSVRGLRTSLVEALRLIGPARPWGAPLAALREIRARRGRASRRSPLTSSTPRAAAWVGRPAQAPARRGRGGEEGGHLHAPVERRSPFSRASPPRSNQARRAGHVDRHRACAPAAPTRSRSIGTSPSNS